MPLFNKINKIPAESSFQFAPHKRQLHCISAPPYLPPIYNLFNALCIDPYPTLWNMLVPVDSGEVHSIDVSGVIGLGQVTRADVAVRKSGDNMHWNRNLVREELHVRMLCE